MIRLGRVLYLIGFALLIVGLKDGASPLVQPLGFVVVWIGAIVEFVASGHD